MPTPTQNDQKLIDALQRRVLQSDPDWSCANRAHRDAAHGLIQYPAMMVPSMQRDILSVVFEARPEAQLVMDPFVGSGTALTETLAAGRSFVGYDINPLAILVSRVKARPDLAEQYAAAAEQVLSLIEADSRTDYAVDFPNRDKWFRPSNSIGLSRIRRAAERIADSNVRRFIWVALAETIRRCSNSRTSTYKLHIRQSDEIEMLEDTIVPTFALVLKANVKRMNQEKQRLIEARVMNNRSLHNNAIVHLADICDDREQPKQDQVDVVLTSPPYGDNRTTVPYGQFSYLALRWIPLEDIDPSIDRGLLETTHSLDTASVGGRKRRTGPEVDELAESSSAFLSMYHKLLPIDREAARRWYAYCRDLGQSLKNTLKPVRSGGYLVWIIGQRRMRSMGAPLVAVLNQLHEAAGATVVTNVERRIPSKRMPSHNAIGALMQTEHVCFYRKQ